MSSSLHALGQHPAAARYLPSTGLACSMLVLLAACGKDAAPGAAGAAGGPPPATVGVITVANETIALQTELPGRVSPLRVAQVRSRVNGVVQKRLFREGGEVKAGQALYQTMQPRTVLRWTAHRPVLPKARPIWPRPRPRWSATSHWSKPTPSASRNTPRWSPPRSRPRPM